MDYNNKIGEKIMDFYELREKIRTKKLASSIILFILGLTLLLMSVINGVKNDDSWYIKHVSSSQQPYYYVKVDGTLETYGCFSVKSAEVVVQILDKNRRVIKEEKFGVRDKFVYGRTRLDSEWGGIPYDVVVKINKIRFNNTWAVILSSGILVVSVVDFILKIKKPKEAQTK